MNGVLLRQKNIVGLLAVLLVSAALALTGANRAYAADVTRIFTDVESGAWYEEPVQWAYDRGFIMGYADRNALGPNDSLTRAQAAIILSRVAGGVEEIACNQTNLPDVYDNMYYTSAVNWAVRSKYITGYADKSLFGPEDPITREQLAVILHRFLGNLGVSGSDADLDRFPDSYKVSRWSKDAVSWAVSNHIIQGSLGNIDPQGVVTRAQMAAFLQRGLALSEGKRFYPDYIYTSVDDYETREVAVYGEAECYHVWCSHCGFGCFILWDHMIEGEGLSVAYPDEYEQYKEVLWHIEHGDCLTPSEKSNRDYDMIHTADERVKHLIQTGTRTEVVKAGSHTERLSAGGSWL